MVYQFLKIDTADKIISDKVPDLRIYDFLKCTILNTQNENRIIFRQFSEQYAYVQTAKYKTRVNVYGSSLGKFTGHEIRKNKLLGVQFRCRKERVPRDTRRSSDNYQNDLRYKMLYLHRRIRKREFEAAGSLLQPRRSTCSWIAVPSNRHHSQRRRRERSPRGESARQRRRRGPRSFNKTGEIAGSKANVRGVWTPPLPTLSHVIRWPFGGRSIAVETRVLQALMGTILAYHYA